MPRSAKYPVQIVLMVSSEVGELVERLATEQDLHKTEVSRAFLHAGIRKAGYADVLFADKREIPLDELAPTDEEVTDA
jgi:hypothetical protein